MKQRKIFQNLMMVIVGLSTATAFAICPNEKVQKDLGTSWAYGLGYEIAVDEGQGKVRIIRPYVSGDFTSLHLDLDGTTKIGGSFSGSSVCRCLGYAQYEKGSKKIEYPGFVAVVRPVGGIVVNEGEAISELLCTNN